MIIPDYCMGTSRAQRYRQAFSAYESRCPLRNQLVFQKIAQRLSLQILGDVSVLDVGVGNGAVANLTRYINCPLRITAIDSDPSCFPTAVSAFVEAGVRDLRLIHADMQDRIFMESLSDSFNIVVASNVLYRHAKNETLIRSILNCCKKRGYFVIVHATTTAPWTALLADTGNWPKECHGSGELKKTLSEMDIPFNVDTVHYSVKMDDIINSNILEDHQVDALLWMLPRNIVMTEVRAEELIAIIRKYMDRNGEIMDERDIIIIRRD